MFTEGLLSGERAFRSKYCDLSDLYSARAAAAGRTERRATGARSFAGARAAEKDRAAAILERAEVWHRKPEKRARSHGGQQGVRSYSRVYSPSTRSASLRNRKPQRPISTLSVLSASLSARRSASARLWYAWAAGRRASAMPPALRCAIRKRCAEANLGVSAFAAAAGTDPSATAGGKSAAATPAAPSAAASLDNSSNPSAAADTPGTRARMRHKTSGAALDKPVADTAPAEAAPERCCAPMSVSFSLGSSPPALRTARRSASTSSRSLRFTSCKVARDA